MGTSSLRAQVGTEVGTEIIDGINAEIELASYFTEEVKDIKRDERRTTLRRFMVEPNVSNYVAYWYPALSGETMGRLAVITMPLHVSVSQLSSD